MKKAQTKAENDMSEKGAMSEKCSKRNAKVQVGEISSDRFAIFKWGELILLFHFLNSELVYTVQVCHAR